ncbi:MAG: hypothetical protein ACYCQJ_06420 [Nitrososphaerales archaeon]
MPTLDIPPGITLEQFLSRELLASSLKVRELSKDQILIESDSIVRIHVAVDSKTKSVLFDLFSPRWSRRITVQQLGGFDFMESQAEEKLLKEDAEIIAEDALLTIDLIRSWGEKNEYRVEEVEPTKEIPSTENAR